MRKIKFRGKLPNVNIWIYGHLIEQCGAKSLKSPRCYIVVYDEKIEDYDWEKPCNVERESVGQFTGMYDCDGKEIYEGDIIKAKDSCAVVEVVFKQGCWCIDNHNLDLADERFCLYDELQERDWAVIGNVYDDPNLLEGMVANEKD